MNNPKIKLNKCTYAQITLNKTGDLAMVYKPLLNLINGGTLGDFTTEHLNFDRYTSEDMLIVDEFDGSTNIIINDDKNQPRLINSGFAVQEDNTFLVPEHYTNTVNNLYQDTVFELDTQLFKLYNKIPSLKFCGLSEGGAFKCGSYIFYFRLADSYGNMSNVIQHSSIVQIPIGLLKSYKQRMGMQDELTDKSINFELTDLDGGFDYVRVFYERTSTANDQSQVTLFYMIDLNFPILDGKCSLKLTGEELILGIDLSDLKNEYADIATCKTHTIVDNTLFMGNVSSFVHDYKELQKLAWCIYPTQEIDKINLPLYSKMSDELSIEGYYLPENVYYKVGYWPDEYYRFGIVFIYNNNLLSPVFNILGYDLNADVDQGRLLSLIYNNRNGKNEFFDSEPDDFIFKEEIKSNSKGVTHLKPRDLDYNYIEVSDIGEILMPQVYIRFNLEGLEKWFTESQDLTLADRNKYKTVLAYLQQRHGIKGFFFVRQKRIPTNLALGIVVGLTTKEHGSIPILKNGDVWETKSFLSKDRLILPIGSTITVQNNSANSKVVTKALLVPDAELQEATFNSIFTSSDFALVKEGKLLFDVYKNDIWRVKGYNSGVGSNQINKVKLTSIPQNTRLKTNGEDYFSTIAGTPEEAYKTEDINNVWNKTLPLDLTRSSSLIRGKWGYYVGMGYDDSINFDFGDIVTIKKVGFANDNANQHFLEFQERFNDYSFYSPISTRYNIEKINNRVIDCYNGDCFPSMFTHRMMSNFIDPELPTNTKVVDPSCWAKNYAVRCTAEWLSETHSNLTSDSAGFFIPSPVSKKSKIVSLVFGLLTGNLGILIKAAADLADNSENRIEQSEFANEIAQAFEIYTGIPSASSEAWSLELDNPITSGGYTEYSTESDSDNQTIDVLEKAASEGKLKLVQPLELEKSSTGLNLKALFKSDDKWELHGTAQINRADVNAVSFGLWIMFPIRSSLNLALRDVDFNNTTEEAKFNRKRSFFPLENMDIADKLPESNVINGAAKKTVYKNTHPAYKTLPFMKLEYFNRIYWSKPNVSEAFLNSFRMVYTNLYKEYNKEFGDITKILPVGNSLFVCFDHGLGILPIDRTIKNEVEASPYLASRNVLPPQVHTLSKDFGSMWKNSVIQTPKGLIYGVDTTAKKIWKSDGQQVQMISDHVVSKFLTDWLKLSEFDYKSYLGHVDVKTHYNNFKNDVMFTFVKDIPIYSTNIPKDDLKYYIQLLYGANSLVQVVIGKYNSENGTLPFAFGNFNGTIDDGYILAKIDNGKTVFIYEDGSKFELLNTIFIVDKYADILLGKIYINDLFTGVRLEVDSWIPGVKWSLCYNEELNKFITFYDWYPVESCNVDNIYFSFDQDKIDTVYDNNESSDITCVKISGQDCNSIEYNKYFIDDAFSTAITIHRLLKKNVYNINLKKDRYLSFYYKPSSSLDTNKSPLEVQELPKLVTIKMKDGWYFSVFKIDTEDDYLLLSISNNLLYLDVAEMKIFKISNWEEYDSLQNSDRVKDNFKYYDIRDYNSNRMYLWKHGQAGLYDNEGKILPTNWYGKLHEFNFEFIVHDLTPLLKIFNNLKVVSNKARPEKFEYEIVGEGYEWWPYKELIYWANEQVTDSKTLKDIYSDILSKPVNKLRDEGVNIPVTFVEERSSNPDFKYSKLPYLEIELTDRKGRQDKSYHVLDKWDSYRKDSAKKYDHTFNTNETVIKYDELLNEYRIHDELLGNDILKYGRARGNMQYLEDYWNVEIRPLNFQWAYLDNNGDYQVKSISEARHRDKYIKIKVRYSGKDLAIIQMIHTMFDQSFA